MNRIKFLAGLAVAASAFAGAVAPVAAQSTPAAPDAAIAAAKDYRLGAGDVIRISVFQNPDLTLETRVSESGVISFPLLGPIKIGGMAPAQAEKVIADGLRNGNFIKQPQVSVLVVQVRGNQVSVLGQVNRPGRFPIEVADIHLTDMLANAGGISAGGADIVTVVGTRNGQPFRAEIDLPTVFDAKGRANDIALQNGDVIWVDRTPVVYIYGEVQRPGAMRLERDMTVLQALAAGGGLTLRGTEKGIAVHRKGADGKIEVLKPTMDELVRPGDVVYVRESLF
jgi:polysaccharide export outer membrane protein